MILLEFIRLTVNPLWSCLLCSLQQSSTYRPDTGQREGQQCGSSASQGQDAGQDTPQASVGVNQNPALASEDRGCHACSVVQGEVVPDTDPGSFEEDLSLPSISVASPVLAQSAGSAGARMPSISAGDI